jgi:flagellar basal body-associated protein FliL
MICPKCKSTNVTAIGHVQTKKKGCLVTLLMIPIHIMIFCFTIIGSLFFLLFRKSGKKVETKTKFVCMNCRNEWF